MKQDPFDPNPDSDLPKILFIGTLIASVVVGVWWWANSQLSRVFPH